MELFYKYLVDYINHELELNNDIDINTIYNAIEAFKGGAR